MPWQVTISNLAACNIQELITMPTESGFQMGMQEEGGGGRVTFLHVVF